MDKISAEFIFKDMVAYKAFHSALSESIFHQQNQLQKILWKIE